MRPCKIIKRLTAALVLIGALCVLYHRLLPDELDTLVVDDDNQIAGEPPVCCVCATFRCIMQYDSLADSFNYTSRIPTLRHILWKGTNVSSYFARQLKTWQRIHPNWTYVLWRDTDLDRFVAKHYTGALSKFRSLSKKIMQLDMVRYMILHKFGGIYADLDYVLLRPLDHFLKYPAVVTRETEAHALYHFGMGRYPPPLLPNPAFMMSEPRHPFFLYALMQFNCRKADNDVLTFAGPLGLAHVLKRYAVEFPNAEASNGLLIMPPSRNFYAFEGNSLASSTSSYKAYIVNQLQMLCNKVRGSAGLSANLTAYCTDVNNLDPITDPRDTVYAIHDYNKSHSSYDAQGSKEFQSAHQVDIRSVLPNVLMADSML